MKAKLILATCGPLLLGSIALLTSDYFEQKNAALEDAREDIMLMARNQASELDEIFYSIEAEIKQQANVASEFNFTSPNDLYKVLGCTLSVNPDIFGSFFAFEPGIAGDGKNEAGLFGPLLTRTNGNKTQRRQIEERYDYRSSDFYLLPQLMGEPSWGEPLRGETTGKEHIVCVYSAPVHREGKFVGISGATVKLNDLSRELSNKNTMFNGYVGLISKNGTIIAHPRDKFVMNWSIYALAEWFNRPDLAALGKRMASGESAIVRRKEFDSSEMKWIVFTPMESTGWSLMIAISEDLVVAQATQAIKRRVFYFIIGIIVILVITAYISMRIARRLNRMAIAADHISKGNLNLASKSLDQLVKRQHCSMQNRDETKRLIMSMDSMVNRLDSMVESVQGSADGIHDSSETIATQVEEIEVASTEQAASTNQIVASAKEIAATARDLAKTMQTVLQATQQTEATASEGQDDLNHMHETMKNLQDKTSLISDKLTDIHQKAENITCIITTIVQVADRTNLLSLNAAIEAEQAGEQGKGFAVVASEIRRLADQTAAATLHIEKTVKEMLDSVVTGVDEMDKFNSQVKHDVESVDRIGKQMGQIIGDVQDLGPKFLAVQEGMDAQAIAASQISEAMTQVSEGAQHNVAAINELNQIAQALHFSAENLNSEVSSFTSKDK